MCLLAAIVMLIAGETTPGGRLKGLGFVIYWLACVLCATLAMLSAILDARALRREARNEQRALLEDALEEIQREKAQSSKPEIQNNFRPSTTDSSSRG